MWRPCKLPIYCIVLQQAVCIVCAVCTVCTWCTVSSVCKVCTLSTLCTLYFSSVLHQFVIAGSLYSGHSVCSLFSVLSVYSVLQKCVTAVFYSNVFTVGYSSV